MDKQQVKDTLDHLGDKAESKLEQAKGWMKEQWGWLTDDELKQMEGKAEQIKAKVKEHFGDAKWEAEYQKFKDAHPDFDK